MSLDLDKLDYLKPKKQKNMYLGSVYCEDHEINMQLKRKVSSKVYRKGNKYCVDIIFDGENKRDLKFLKLYKDLENKTIKEIYENYNKWLDPEGKVEWEDIYSSFSSKLSKENEINTITFNVITDGNIMLTRFFNEDEKKVAYKYLEEGDEVSFLVHFKGIKFGKNKFENYWEILEMKIYDNVDEEELSESKEEKKISESCQIDIESDTDNEQELSVYIEDIEKMEELLEENIQKYNEEQKLDIID